MKKQKRFKTLTYPKINDSLVIFSYGTALIEKDLNISI